MKKKTKKNNIYNIIQIKSLEEIKRQKEKQLEEFLRFDPKKFHRKKIDNNNEKKNYIENKRENSDSNSRLNNDEDSENESKNSKNQIAMLFEDENWEYYDSQDNFSEDDAAKWDKDKVILTFKKLMLHNIFILRLLFLN